MPGQGQEFDDFLNFFLFFSPNAFRSIAQREPLIERARRGSSEYRVGVGEGLKGRVFDALSFCVEGFLAYAPNNLSPNTDMEQARQNSLVLLYRLLFVLFAEDRGLLPYRLNKTYTENRSLARFRDDIATQSERIRDGRDSDYPADQHNLWSDLQTLFDLIDSGKHTYGVPAYNGGLFAEDLHPFLKTKVLPDRYLARVIDSLGRAPDATHPNSGLFRVDYRDLAIQHLGNVYEGLLELRPRYAAQEMMVIRNRASDRKEEKVVPISAALEKGWEPTQTKYTRGSIYLETDKGERRATGSYYTPNHIVDYIVEKTLAPICERINAELEKDIARVEDEIKHSRGEVREGWQTRLEQLTGDFDERLLRLRVLDPAMGSGHFLIRACQYLAEQIATNPNTRDSATATLTAEESLLVFWKRRVVEACLYGVDRNPMAVELAKLALWLETVAIQQPLTFLDHHLRCGDSLVGAAVADLSSLPDAVGTMYQDIFEQQVKQRLPALLAGLKTIRNTQSETLLQVKEKEKLFRKVIEPVRIPLVQTAHVWISHFFLPPAERISTTEFGDLLAVLTQPQKAESLLSQPPYAKAIAAAGPNGAMAFHWELEFPEVFFGEAGFRTDAGFDAIIGNPPYDVLSEKESGRDLSQFRSFLEHCPTYKPSFGGKNNLYKLFICRALLLLTNNGRLGFITPMAVLGDDQAAGIRKEILRVGAFAATEAFPQKDDPRRRVFADAKLATAIFVLQKSDNPAERARTFRSRVHPANLLCENSPSLELSTSQIPLYDPENLTIVSCSQDDWDIAVRIMSGDRCVRLGSLCMSFQGEINETNDRNHGRISYDAKDGPEVIRGAHVCLYGVRDASQGTPVYVRVADFTQGVLGDRKSTHNRYDRAGFQRKSPQNNFRRLIAAPIAKGTFLLESVSYVPAHHSKLPLRFIVAILNSKLAEWYFTLGSTNAMVAEYEFNNLPCPVFAESATAADRKLHEAATSDLAAGKTQEALTIFIPSL